MWLSAFEFCQVPPTVFLNLTATARSSSITPILLCSSTARRALALSMAEDLAGVVNPHSTEKGSVFRLNEFQWSKLHDTGILTKILRS